MFFLSQKQHTHTAPPHTCEPHWNHTLCVYSPPLTCCEHKLWADSRSDLISPHVSVIFTSTCATHLYSVHTPANCFPPLIPNHKVLFPRHTWIPLCVPTFPLLFICAFFFLFSTCFYSAFFSLQIRKLRRELDASQEKVSALTTQLSANVGGHRYILLRWLFILLLYLWGIINSQFHI